MRNKYNLYVTDWAPNGTNDLLICDEDHEICGTVQSATFGIDVTKHRSPVNDIVADFASLQVFSIKRTEEPLPSELTLVRQITLAELRRYLAVSPVDPNGNNLIERLKTAGVDLTEGE